MPRVKDVDTVAPDDAIVTTPIPAKKPKKVSPLTANIAPATNLSESQPAPARQEIYNILGHTSHPFSSFLVRPKVFKFQEQDTEEEIILVLRRHWFTNLKWILVATLMFLLPSLNVFLPVLDYFTPSAGFIIMLFWYLITFAYAFEQILSWWFNVCIITDERVVDIDFSNILVKKFSDAKINMIQDVTSQVVGVSQTLFNYGTVLVQTAAEVPEIEFQYIPNPEKVIKVLQQLRQEEEQEAIEGRVR